MFLAMDVPPDHHHAIIHGQGLVLRRQSPVITDDEYTYEFCSECCALCSKAYADSLSEIKKGTGPTACKESAHFDVLIACENKCNEDQDP